MVIQWHGSLFFFPRYLPSIFSISIFSGVACWITFNVDKNVHFFLLQEFMIWTCIISIKEFILETLKYSTLSCPLFLFPPSLSYTHGYFTVFGWITRTSLWLAVIKVTTFISKSAWAWALLDSYGMGYASWDKIPEVLPI